MLSPEPHAFTEQDINRLELLAALLSSTLNDAAGAEAIQVANRSLQDANQQLMDQKIILEKANIQLQSLATTDGLTGLKNHRAFRERLEEEFQRAVRYKSQLSLVLLDVDHFKSFNDTFGHPAGDVVLQQLAKLLMAAARTTDCVARHGGEEFALILPETDIQGALISAERVRKMVADDLWDKRAISVSVGVSTLNGAIKSASQLLEIADQALYQSKAGGRNRVMHADKNGLHAAQLSLH